MLSGKLVVAVDGGTESVRVALVDAERGVVVRSASRPYATACPQNGWAEQSPADWWAAVSAATAECSAGADPAAIIGMSFVTTTCTLLPCAADGVALRSALLWSDVRAAVQADRVFETQHPAVLRYTSAGFSAEWMLAKTMWLAEHQPELFQAAVLLLEYGDWLAMQLTGRAVLCANTATQRWLYDNSGAGAGCGWPVDLFAAVGLPGLEQKLPADVLQVGALVGGLTAAAALALGGSLPAGLPVFAGGGDAFVGLLGMGVCSDGAFGLMTGSSNVLSGLTKTAGPAGHGLFGGFPGAVVPGLSLLEAGQPATGSMLRWFQSEMLGGAISLSGLDALAAAVPPGSGGVVCFDGFQVAVKVELLYLTYNTCYLTSNTIRVVQQY
jgi:ribulose kinase